MVDDSDFEVDLIREFLPEVTVIGMPAGKPTEYRGILAGSGLFDTLTLSAEDRARGAAYQAEVARKRLQSETADMGSFLQSLAMSLEIRLADDFAQPRIAQLTQKTNQFNLTTRRYSEEDIQRFRESDDADVIYLRYRDRFGDAGIVGVCILRYEHDAAVVDSLMLSCRILGRSVEQTFLAHCLARAGLRGAVRALGEYRPTAKNAQVKEFYPANGFSSAAGLAEGVYRIELAALPLPAATLFRIETDLMQESSLPESRVLGIQGEATA